MNKKHFNIVTATLAIGLALLSLAAVIYPGTTGTVSSVGLTLPAIFTVTGSPVTGSGSLTATLASESANTVLAGPTSGGAAAPTFRAPVVADIPTGTYTLLTSTTFYTPTNSFAGATNNLDVSVQRQHYYSFTSCSFTGITGKSSSGVAQHVLLSIYNASATNITLVIPSSVCTSDGARSYTITNATVGLIGIEWSHYLTNAIFHQFN